jgi:hypothetical protein
VGVASRRFSAICFLRISDNSQHSTWERKGE